MVGNAFYFFYIPAFIHAFLVSFFIVKTNFHILDELSLAITTPPAVNLCHTEKVVNNPVPPTPLTAPLTLPV